tara:strand:+ start:1968 stop:2243 length:276 start_codon:yes stop_codon:yes gene_type:complete
MNKYGEITTTGGSGLISLMNVASCYIDANDDVIIDYNNGSSIAIASASALVQGDADIVFGVIKSSQQHKWSTVKYTIPALSEDVNAVTFTF